MEENFETIYKNGSRIYKKDGIHYPSVTSICSVKSEFKKSSSGNDYSRFGTLMHHDLSSLYKWSEHPYVSFWKMSFDEVEAKRRSCLRMWRDVADQFDIKNVEFAVFNNESDAEYAGRVDFSCVDSEDVPAIGDWKSGKNYNYYLWQMSAYAHCLGYDRAYLVFLDSNTERNPEQKAVIQRLDQPQLSAGYSEFLDCYRIFKELNAA